MPKSCNPVRKKSKKKTPSRAVSRVMSVADGFLPLLRGRYFGQAGPSFIYAECRHCG